MKRAFMGEDYRLLYIDIITLERTLQQTWIQKQKKNLKM